MELEGLFNLSLAGILVSVAEPLAEIGINIFAIANYETDYLLMKEERLELSASTLTERGYVVRRYARDE